MTARTVSAVPMKYSFRTAATMAPRKSQLQEKTHPLMDFILDHCRQRVNCSAFQEMIWFVEKLRARPPQQEELSAG